MIYKNISKISIILFQRHYRKIEIFLIFFLFFLAFFHKGFITGTFYTIGDQFVYLHPLRNIAWTMIKQGSLPLWVPHIFSGYPILSQSHLCLAYPLTWGYLFLSSSWAEQVFVLAPFLLAPIFTYCYVRVLGKSPIAGILAGLSFGYGGYMASWTTNGMVTNALMWLPLILIPVFKVQDKRFVKCYLGATGAYLGVVLTGAGQGYIQVGLTAIAYSIWLSTRNMMSSHGDRSLRERLFYSWRPFIICVSGIVTAAGLVSFQILESWQAKTHSIRNVLSYERFSEMAYSPITAIKAFLAPLYNYIETTPFVPSITAILAIIAIILVVKGGKDGSHTIFWVFIGLVSGLLMLGPSTPLNAFVYQIPLLNSFRGPSRHSFEWTFAMSILAAFGWDYVAEYFEAKRNYFNVKRTTLLCIALTVVTVIVGILWIKDTPIRNVFTDGDVTNREIKYLYWKAIFTFIAILGLISCLLIKNIKARMMLLCTLVLVTCFVEPYINQTRWWGKYTLTADRMSRISPAAKWLQQYSSTENRIYTRVRLLDGQINPERLEIDAPNQPVLAGLHNVAGYEPLVSQRYSQALGNVGMDGVTINETVVPSESPLSDNSHVLDLLNTRFLVTYKNLSIDRKDTIDKDGIEFIKADLTTDLLKEGTLTFDKLSLEGDTLGVVTSIVDSAGVENGTPIAKIEIHTENGEIVTREILAGTHTAEWAHERSDVRKVIRHSLAPVFDTSPGDEANSFPGHRYFTAISLGKLLKITEIRIIKILNIAPLRVWKCTVYDSVQRSSLPVDAVDNNEKIRKIFDPARWVEVHRTKDVIIFRNNRAMPRVWLVGAVKTVIPEEALNTITGKSNLDFDPQQIALIEANQIMSPLISQLSKKSATLSNRVAKIVSYENNSLKIETSSDQPSFMVLSEVNYPGWKAYVNGSEASIHQTNYLLRGVALPAGKNTVLMEYSAPAARNGVYISLITLLIVSGLAMFAFKQKEPVNNI